MSATRRPYVVAVTGGVASGKSAVTDALARHGVPIVDADVVSRELVEPGEPALAEIAWAFGRGVIDDHGRLERRVLRGIVFEDAAARRKLEAILHPRVAARMHERALAAGDVPYVVLAIPLLAEVGRYDFIDCVVVVDAADEVRIERVMRRDRIGREQAEAMLAAQVDRATRLALADEIVRNDGTLEALAVEVDALHARLLARAAAR